MSLALCKRVINDFQKEFRECKIVVMPDFFLDRIITLNCTIETFSELMLDVAKRKGGSLDGISQTDLRGGNAINVASALASLGVIVTPMVYTSQDGLEYIKQLFKNKPVDISHVKICHRPSKTTALEFLGQGEKTNIMLRDLGELADFGPKNFSERDYGIIKDADYTCLFNWAGTLKFGTALARNIFENAKKGGSKTYFDSADPLPNSKAIPDLIEKVLKTNLVDILSVNENEAIVYASFLDEPFKSNQELREPGELVLEAARVLSRHLEARIDLHTSLFSATLKDNREVVVPAFKIRTLRATGAGDAWDAGNILADHYGLSDECRLTLANAVSACYLQDPQGQHPSREEIFSFVNSYINSKFL